jgi:di/tricarboxylate transporter
MKWDTLLIFGPRSRVEALYETDDFVPLGERDLKIRLTHRWWISATIIPVVVLLAAFGVMSILKASILGAVFLLVSRCITIQQAYRSVDWTVIFLLAAILPLGLAMENTGLADVIAVGLSALGEQYGPLVMLSILYLATSLLTSFFSNNATAVLMVPIAFTAAEFLQVDAKPLLMAVAYAASASFYDADGVPDKCDGVQSGRLPVQRLPAFWGAAESGVLDHRYDSDSDFLAVQPLGPPPRSWGLGVFDR